MHSWGYIHESLAENRKILKEKNVHARKTEKEVVQIETEITALQNKINDLKETLQQKNKIIEERNYYKEIVYNFRAINEGKILILAFSDSFDSDSDDSDDSDNDSDSSDIKRLKIKINFEYNFELGGYKFRELESTELEDPVQGRIEEYMKERFPDREIHCNFDDLEKYVEEQVENITDFRYEKACYDDFLDGGGVSGRDELPVKFVVLYK